MIYLFLFLIGIILLLLIDLLYISGYLNLLVKSIRYFFIFYVLVLSIYWFFLGYFFFSR